MPGRARDAPDPAVRHRAGRPAARLRPGRARRRSSRSCSGLTLEKGHSAADWSTRPLPEPWLRYAALDVEVLVELRDALAGSSTEQGKLDWAERGVRRDRGRAAASPAGRPVAAHRPACTGCATGGSWLWCASCGSPRRDRPARATSRPGRVLPDAAIVAPRCARAARPRPLLRAARVAGTAARRQPATWLPAIEAAPRAARGRPAGPQARPVDGPPPARRWAERDPVAAARLAAARAALGASPPSTACRSRTCSAPTRCAASRGPRRPIRPRASPPSCAATARARGRSRSPPACSPRRSRRRLATAVLPPLREPPDRDGRAPTLRRATRRHRGIDRRRGLRPRPCSVSRSRLLR